LFFRHGSPPIEKALARDLAKHHRNIPLTAASLYKCMSKVLLIGKRSLRLALTEYVAHYHAERNHQGKDSVLLFPRDTQTRRGGPVHVAKGWAGRCIIIIKEPRNLAEKSWMILWPSGRSHLTAQARKELPQD
jgi:hypothetical protein